MVIPIDTRMLAIIIPANQTYKSQYIYKFEEILQPNEHTILKHRITPIYIQLS